MHLRSILAIARKDAIDILLNKSTMISLAMPIVLALVFLLISKLIGGHTTNILVYNPGQSRLVQVVSGAFASVKVTEAASPAAVTTAFGPNGSKKETPYDVGLVIPANFEDSLRAGSRPQASLYVSESNVDPHTVQLLQAAILDYARQVASPQPPLTLSVATMNQPSLTNLGNFLQNIYAGISLLMSFIIGVSLMPGLLIEEKEKKTLRMLMVTPASFADIVIGKILVVLIYQFLLSLLILVIMDGFVGQVPLLLLYTLLGACFSLTLGVLWGGIFSTASTAGAAAGILSLLYVIPAFFSGPLGRMLGNSAFAQVVKVLPTYYMADGIYSAMGNQGTSGGHLLDISVIAGSTLVLVVIAAWVLRRQAAVAASI